MNNSYNTDTHIKRNIIQAINTFYYLWTKFNGNTRNMNKEIPAQGKKYDYLIVGAGLFGATFSYLMKQKGKSSLIIDKRSHIGGNIYCQNVDGINIHKYGAHIFHTNNKEVWEFVNQHVEFNRYTNSPLANYKGELYNLPFNMNTFYKLWGVITPTQAQERIEKERNKFSHILTPKNLEEQALTLCGEEIYEKLIKGYTEKQWGRSTKELPPFIIKRIPFRFKYDNNYFNDPYQGIPIGGYNKLIESLIEGTDIKLECDYLEHKDQLDKLAQKVVYTGCIDELFNYEFGALEYRGLRFEHERHNSIKDFQGNAVINYTEAEVPYTRIIEHKHFEFGDQDFTIITKEYPSECQCQRGDVPYYPVNNKENSEIHQKYKERAKLNENLILGGRLAQYAYFDMDDTIAAAMLIANKETL